MVWEGGIGLVREQASLREYWARFVCVAAAVAVVAVAAERVHWLLQRLFLFDGLWDGLFGQMEPVSSLRGRLLTP